MPINGYVEFPTGKRLVYGTVTLDGSNPTGVDLSGLLSGIDSAVVCWETDTAQGADPTTVTYAISTTTLNVYAWKYTTGGAGGNPDLVASTNSAAVVAYMAIGAKVARTPQ